MIIDATKTTLSREMEKVTEAIRFYSTFDMSGFGRSSGNECVNLGWVGPGRLTIEEDANMFLQRITSPELQFIDIVDVLNSVQNVSDELLKQGYELPWIYP